jgi:hypothetical protein
MPDDPLGEYQEDKIVDLLRYQERRIGGRGPPWPPLQPPGGGGTFDGMEARVAKLEAVVEHIQRDISDIKGDVRGLRTDARTDFRMLFRGYYCGRIRTCWPDGQGISLVLVLPWAPGSECTRGPRRSLGAHPRRQPAAALTLSFYPASTPGKAASAPRRTRRRPSHSQPTAPAHHRPLQKSAA